MKGVPRGSGGRSILAPAVRGLITGLAGTLAVAGSDHVERAILGRDPLYLPRYVARRLLVRAGAAPDRRSAVRLGLLLRWTYGPFLGILSQLRLPGSRLPGTGSILPQGLLTGSAVLALELLAMPLAGAAPPLRTWPARQVLMLALHTTAFGMGTALASRLLRAAAGRIPARARRARGR